MYSPLADRTKRLSSTYVSILVGRLPDKRIRSHTKNVRKERTKEKRNERMKEKNHVKWHHLMIHKLTSHTRKMIYIFLLVF